VLFYKITIKILQAKPGVNVFFLVVLLINAPLFSLGNKPIYTYPQLRFDSIVADSLSSDTLFSDTLFMDQEDENALQSEVKYLSRDSIRFDISHQKAYLYGDAEVYYETTILKAEYIELDMKSSTVFAKGAVDSLGKLVGKPVFIDDGQEFSTETITYNFETKKGLITDVITKEGEGFIHSDTAKKFEDDILYIKNGAYTTCDLPHPHFAIKSPKIKIIPDDKIVTGPAYLTIADIPTPLAVPFGLFPNKKGRSSGILIPTYGESTYAGFFLKEGGYYFGINDHIDLALRGDVYSKGSWAARAYSTYKKRYKYNGDLSFRYSTFKFGEPELPEFTQQEDYFLTWTHKQDPKARPTSRFSAKVNAGSSSYNKFNSNNSADYLKNTFQSTIAFSKSWSGKPYNFAANVEHSQNTITKKVDLSLPRIMFSVNRFAPFKSRKGTGSKKWHDKIGISYRMDAINKISTYDSLLFTETKMSDFSNGVKHSLPINTSINIFKYLNLSPTFNYTDRWYFQTIEKTWVDDTLFTETDTIIGYVRSDTVPGFRSASDFSFNAILKTRLYGMMQFKSKNIKAIRHVLTPNVTFSYRPDFGDKQWDHFREVQIDTLGTVQSYSRYGDYTTWRGVYGQPQSGKFGVLQFSLKNNLEMKVSSKKDTANPIKKIMLIENLTLSSNYNMALDSLNWSDLILSGYTRLINNNLYVKYAASFDPYVLVQDSIGNTYNVNRFEVNENGRLARIRNSDWYFSLNMKLGPDMFKKNTTEPVQQSSTVGTPEELEMINNNLEDYIDFSIPWSLNISYNLSYLNKYYYASSVVRDSVSDQVIQTLAFSGEINLTDKWRIGFRSGYDIKNEEFTYTTIDIYRDLHCWEMNFNWVPFGFNQSYNFGIKVKSSVLQDLKLTRKRQWYDNGL